MATLRAGDFDLPTMPVPASQVKYLACNERSHDGFVLICPACFVKADKRSHEYAVMRFRIGQEIRRCKAALKNHAKQKEYSWLKDRIAALEFALGQSGG